MVEIPPEIYRQLKLGERKPLTAETTPIIEDHQTSVKLPQKILAEIDLKKGDKLILEVESKAKLCMTIVRSKK